VGGRGATRVVCAGVHLESWYAALTEDGDGVRLGLCCGLNPGDPPGRHAMWNLVMAGRGDLVTNVLRGRNRSARVLALEALARWPTFPEQTCDPASETLDLGKLPPSERDAARAILASLDSVSVCSGCAVNAASPVKRSSLSE